MVMVMLSFPKLPNELVIRREAIASRILASLPLTANPLLIDSTKGFAWVLDKGCDRIQFQDSVTFSIPA
jgi:hypothetical protein